MCNENKSQHFTFDDGELRRYMDNVFGRAEQLLKRNGPNAKPEDARDLDAYCHELMDLHYRLSIVPVALQEIAHLIDVVGQRAAAYDEVFGPGLLDEGANYYAPTQRLSTVIASNHPMAQEMPQWLVDDEDLPF